MKKKLLVSLLALLALGMPLASCGNTNTGSNTPTKESTNEKEVSRLTVKTMPTKTEYFIGENFDPAGGVITITYTDKSTEDVDLSDSRFTITAPNTSTEGKKNVIVILGNKRVTFQVIVKAETFTVTFDYNYEGSTPTTASVKKGEAVAKPEDPTRENYSFVGWFTEAEVVTEYDFSAIVSANLTLYAKWLDNSKQYINVTFDVNWYGLKVTKTVQKVEKGGTATKIEDPTRKGYDFGGWYTDEDATTAFNFTTALSVDTTLYAKWTRNSEYTGAQTYTFEAEDVSLKGMTGKGLSGTVTEKGMILSTPNIGASNDRVVGYLYKPNLALKFYFYSDIDTTGTFTLRLSEEVQAITFNPSNFRIAANGTVQQYSDMAFTADEVPAQTATNPYAQCKDFVINSNLTIKKGRNSVVLTVANTQTTAGTTFEAAAPLVDCIKIGVTDAVMDWDGNSDLPAKNY